MPIFRQITGSRAFCCLRKNTPLLELGHHNGFITLRLLVKLTTLCNSWAMLLQQQSRRPAGPGGSTSWMNEASSPAVTHVHIWRLCVIKSPAESCLDVWSVSVPKQNEDRLQVPWTCQAPLANLFGSDSNLLWWLPEPRAAGASSRAWTLMSLDQGCGSPSAAHLHLPSPCANPPTLSKRQIRPCSCLSDKSVSASLVCSFSATPICSLADFHYSFFLSKANSRVQSSGVCVCVWRGVRVSTPRVGGSI